MKEMLSWENLEPLVVKWAAQLAFALFFLLIGLLATKLIVAAIRRALERADVRDLLVQFTCTISRVALTLIVGVVVLEQLGVNMTSMVAAMGALGLAVGLALKDSMSNFAAGLMLVAQQPFSKDDYVEAGNTAGIVEDISLTTTTLRTPDNRSVIVPNGTIVGNVVINYSARLRRRVDLVFNIGYEDDIDVARAAILRVFEQEPRILDDPAPVVAANSLGESSVDLIARPWVATDDYWDVYWAVIEAVKKEFDKEGITIPFPQRDVRVLQVA